MIEKNLLADTAKIMEKNKNCKNKGDFCRKIITDGLLTLGYDASICKSCWEKSPSFPAGEYEYIDVIIEGERLLIDIDFRSEFELARSTKTYKSILQMLPSIFVGKADRLQKMIAIVSEAVKQCLKKKGMHIPPWRKAEYIKAKWLSPCSRITPSTPAFTTGNIKEYEFDSTDPEDKNQDGELGEPIFSLSESSEEGKEENVKKEEWQPPEINPRISKIEVKIVNGFASAIEDEMKQ
ncbi:pyruvate kinase isozyme A [Hibiscus syriacus]|uniref:Pyruvate kinase isozyme A n=2 Tax=Hibiscus syriacus TaxID=106335 RepID=A0A6A3C956_HIBSY|nr:pyruvate kinase isozyme A [Hibiscus syriacus]